jgi:hypothetical protein
VDQAQSGVTISDGVDDHPDAEQIEDIVELLSAQYQLLVDRIKVLRAPRDLALDLCLLEFGKNLIAHLVQNALTLRLPMLHKCRDLVVALGMQLLEAYVLQLPLDRVHAQPVS